jgi:hypothetical protein
MGQKLEWFVAGKAHAIRLVTMIHHISFGGDGLLSNKYCPSEKSGVMHVLALELPRLSM